MCGCDMLQKNDVKSRIRLTRTFVVNGRFLSSWQICHRTLGPWKTKPRSFLKESHDVGENYDEVTSCLTNICDSISKMTQTVFTSTSTTHNLTHFITVSTDLSVQPIPSIIIMLLLQLLKTENSRTTVTSVINNLRFHSLQAL